MLNGGGAYFRATDEAASSAPSNPPFSLKEQMIGQATQNNAKAAYSLGHYQASMIRQMYAQMRIMLAHTCPQGRIQSVALTELDSSELWALEACRSGS